MATSHMPSELPKIISCEQTVFALPLKLVNQPCPLGTHSIKCAIAKSVPIT